MFVCISLRFNRSTEITTIVFGFTHVDGLIHTVCQAIRTSTIQEVEQQLVVALEMPEVVLLEVVVAAVVVVVAGAVVVVEVVEDVVVAEVVEVNFVFSKPKTVIRSKGRTEIDALLKK